MRSDRNNRRDHGYHENSRPDRYEDIGSRNYRSSYNDGNGPFGSRYMPGDEYADHDRYFDRGRHYYSDRWNDQHGPYNENLRDEYDLYGVGLNRGRYYGEPYGTMRGDVRNNYRDQVYRGDDRDHDRDHDGFFHRMGERIRDKWNHWRHRDEHHEREREDRERERRYSSYR
jgi:hypothetical protein